MRNRLPEVTLFTLLAALSACPPAPAQQSGSQPPAQTTPQNPAQTPASGAPPPPPPPVTTKTQPPPTTTTAPLPETPAMPPKPAAPPATAAGTAQPVVLDHVVAIIDGDVILQSDIAEEMRYAILQPFNATHDGAPQQAFERLVDRGLILQQMKQGQPVAPPTEDEVQKQIHDLRTHIPDCARFHCTTDEGWAAFLKAHQLTQQEVEQHWRQRMLLLKFIEVRFRSGIRIAPAEIQQYYNQQFVPQFVTRKLQPPALASVSSRIDEILLQQRVNVQLQDWLKSLKEEGSVSILDPAYGQVGTTGAEQDEPASGGVH